MLQTQALVPSPVYPGAQVSQILSGSVAQTWQFKTVHEQRLVPSPMYPGAQVSQVLAGSSSQTSQFKMPHKHLS